MKNLVLALGLLIALPVLAKEPQGVGRLGNVQFYWTAGVVRNGLIELKLDKPVPLEQVQIERLRRLPDGVLWRAEVDGWNLVGLTLNLSGSLDEAIAQADRAVPGLSLRIVPEKKEKQPEKHPPVAVVE